MFYIFWSKRNQPHNKQGTVGIYDEELSDRLMSVGMPANSFEGSNCYSTKCK